MKTSFEIIKKNRISSKGNEKTEYYLVRYILGIPFYKKEFTEIFDKTAIIGTIAGASLIANFIIIFFNFMDYIIGNDNNYPMYGIILHVLTTIYFYIYTSKKYKSIYDAEEEIKKYLKLKNFKTSSESVLRYNIDTDNGIFEKETTVKQLK
jgi:hypothetical protein